MLGESSPPFWVIELFRPRFPPPPFPFRSIRSLRRALLPPPQKLPKTPFFFISPYLGRIRNPGIRKRKELSLRVNLSLPFPPIPFSPIPPLCHRAIIHARCQDWREEAADKEMEPDFLLLVFVPPPPCFIAQPDALEAQLMSPLCLDTAASRKNACGPIFLWLCDFFCNHTVCFSMEIKIPSRKNSAFVKEPRCIGA